MPPIVTAKYIRKPLYVDAVQITEENFKEIVEWCQGELRDKDDSPVTAPSKPDPVGHYIHVRVHNPKNARQCRAYVGDWLLYTERGYKVYTTKAFEMQFDPVSSQKLEKKVA